MNAPQYLKNINFPVSFKFLLFYKKLIIHFDEISTIERGTIEILLEISELFQFGINQVRLSEFHVRNSADTSCRYGIIGLFQGQ